MRRRSKVLLAAAAFYAVGSGPAWAGVAADPTSPDGLGGLFELPSLNVGGGGPTLFEAVEGKHYTLYADLGLTDVVKKGANYIAYAFLLLGMLMVRLAVGLTWWMTSLTQTDVGITQLGTSLQSVSSELNQWLLPSALAIGAVVAYARSRTGQDALSQVLWTAGLGIGAVAMATSAPTILDTVDDTRQLVATTMTQAGTEAVTESKVPFEWEGTDLTRGDAQTATMRASGDAVWRSFAVVPWCQAQFGSQEACKRYGADWLKLDSDEQRAEYVEDTIERQEGGDDAATVKYVKGQYPAERIVIGIFMFITGIAVCFVVGGLALLALMPWVTAVLLMFLMTVFLSSLAIPGRIRQIGLDFLNLIGGLTLLSALTTAILTGALMATMAATSAASAQGWLPTAILTIAILLAAWQARTMLERILMVSSAGSTSGGLFKTMMGMAAMRRITHGARNLIRQRSGGNGRSGGRGTRGGTQTRGRSGDGEAQGGGSGGPVGGRRFRFFPGRTERTPRPGTGRGRGRDHARKDRRPHEGRTGPDTEGGHDETTTAGTHAPRHHQRRGGAGEHEPVQSRGGFYQRSRKARQTADQARARERLNERRKRQQDGGQPRPTETRRHQSPTTPKGEHTTPPLSPDARRRARSYEPKEQEARQPRPVRQGAGAREADRTREGGDQSPRPGRRRFSRERRRREGQE